MAFTLQQLVDHFGGRIIGDAQISVSHIAPLDTAVSGQLSFLANPKYQSLLKTTKASAIVLSEGDFAALAAQSGQGEVTQNGAFIITPKPYAYFARAATLFAKKASELTAGANTFKGIHPSAIVDASAQIAPDACIGPYAVIEAHSVIGARARIGAHAYIGQGVHIEQEVQLYPRVTIYAGCTIGARTIIHAGAVIGADGFGFAPDFQEVAGEKRGEWVKIPQVGAVKIGVQVEVGANTTIDRGAMADTVIEEDVKIDNLVQIAHNCHIGAHTVIAACTGIAGSTVIGRHCMLGGAVGIAGHLTLGDHVVVTAKSGVSKSLLKPGMYTSAFPAVEHTAWQRSAAVVRNLDRLRTHIKQLETQVSDLLAQQK